MLLSALIRVSNHFYNPSVTSRAYERLSAQDSSYLKFEDSGSCIHVTATAVFDTGPLAEPGCGLPMDRIRSLIESRLHLLPHYRQRLSYTPVQRHPIWIDDVDFDLTRHVRHAALPQPGNASQLKEFTARIASQSLDRALPLWELWFVEGVSENRFALVAKIHHCMVDGVSGVGALAMLLSPKPDAHIVPAQSWKPRRPPANVEFITDGMLNGAALTTSALESLTAGVQDPRSLLGNVADGATLAWDTLQAAFTPPADTPLNRPTGTGRSVEWCALDLNSVRELRKRLDGSVNDVVLTIVSGAVRRLMKRRRVKLGGQDFRVVIPVDMRSGPVDLRVSNRVSAWFVSLPVSEASALHRFRRINDQTRRLKETGVARGIDGFLRFADWAGSTRLTFWGSSLASLVRPYNLIVTNVHGPEVPLYLLGAPMREFHPQLPLFENQGLAVAVLSYLDQISFGLTGDAELAPELPAFAGDLHESLRELQEAAGARR
jgi:diacylglycerol O-acyltransferase